VDAGASRVDDAARPAGREGWLSTLTPALFIRSLGRLPRLGGCKGHQVPDPPAASGSNRHPRGFRLPGSPAPVGIQPPDGRCTRRPRV